MKMVERPGTLSGWRPEAQLDGLEDRNIRGAAQGRLLQGTPQSRCPQMSTDVHRCPLMSTDVHRCPLMSTDVHHIYVRNAVSLAAREQMSDVTHQCP